MDFNVYRIQAKSGQLSSLTQAIPITVEGYGLVVDVFIEILDIELYPT